MSETKYWQSFGELNDPSFHKKAEDEFPEELPFEGFDDKGLLDAKAPRRDFLKYLGFSTAAATLAASCKIPVKKAIPYADKPADIVPGVPKFYASTYVQDGDAIPAVVKVRDGRPIKIEGNELCSFTGGGTTARMQASVLDLYDMYRVKYPMHRTVGGSDGKDVKFNEVPTFEQLDKMIGDAMKTTTGSVVLLTSTITSPSTKDIISKFPNLRHVQYDAVSYSGMLEANEAAGHGRKLPTYNFHLAKVIVSLGADFLGTWLNTIENAKGYTSGRKINEKNPQMNKHYHFEGHISLTGSNADERFTHRPSETGAVALELLNQVNGGAASSGLSDAKLVAAIKKVADDLKANNGQALVVCGSNDRNVQVIVNAINTAIGAIGKTIDFTAAVNSRQGIDSDMNDLVNQMDAGQVGVLMIQDANPAYDYADAAKFISALKKVKLTISFNRKMDETSELCEYIVPDHHYLESWGDAEPKTGYISFVQPTIFPLFKTRPFQTSLMRWSGNNQDYDTYFREFWTGKLGEQAFNKALQDGVIENSGVTAISTGTPVTTAAGGVDAAIAAIGAYKKGSGTEIVLYQKVAIGTGSQAGNPWLQELPDPVSRATWDNYALISIPKSKELGIKLDTDYEYYPEKPVINVKVGNKEMKLPVLVMPGMNADTIAIAVGYGRNEGMGVTAAGVGTNAYALTAFNGANVDYVVTGAAVSNTGTKYKIAQTQIHNSYENRKEVVRETTLATFKKYPNSIPEYRQHLKEAFYKNANDDYRLATLYPQHDQPGLKWGMNIDMNSCYGCGACVVACSAENNVPVVGKREVLRYHDMHWLRIDRYFVTDHSNPDQLKAVVFQPMLCQHCDNAPCENVCPVNATNHSMEGLNQMAYNRCIGTRYCANNCPFKVRRFNWSDYTGADSFKDNQDQTIVGKLDNVIFQMNDDITRMVLNPDVTVRSRGVMEKCSFCVQRIQSAKLHAKKENRPFQDGDMQTACQQACSADAITFGNAHDKVSLVSKVRQENQQRGYHMLEQIHVLPNITYMAKIRNTDEVIEDEHAVAAPAHKEGAATDTSGHIPARPEAETH